MSSYTKKKHVFNEVLNSYELPKKDQEIVKVLAGRGNNLHEVNNAQGEKFLVSMPSKFRKNVWISRGDFLVVEAISEGVKVKAEIVRVLQKDQIKFFKSEGIWPKEFNDNEEGTNSKNSSDNEDDLFVNTNRKVQLESSETSETDSDDDEDE